MTRYLIDAGCAICAMVERFSALTARLSECRPGDIAISAISFAEIAMGTERGRPPPPDVVDAFLRAIPLLPFDEAAARTYARLPFKRARFDRLLAAHALSIGAIIVTNNALDFVDVPELSIENWMLA